MGKNNSSRSSSPLFLPLQPSPCGRDQFSSSLPTPPGVCYCWVCGVCMYVLLCLLFFLLWEAGGDFLGVYPTPKGGEKSPPYFPTLSSSPSLTFFFYLHDIYSPFPGPLFLQSAPYLFLFLPFFPSSLYSSSFSFRGVCK